MSNPIKKLAELGQSIWCDNISRPMLTGGELQRLIDLGIVGVTSNPTIFMKAITSTDAYDQRLRELLGGGADLMQLYEGLVLPDIADAADTLRPVYDRTEGIDGYVSLEVNPKLAYDTESTITEARRLFAALKRPNILIKVPATAEGMPAIETLIGEGISVNVTLIFSLASYEQVMQAYLRGLQRRAETGGDLSLVASVASFFVSRVDTLIDKLLSEKNGGINLAGLAAVANARLAYARFEQVFAPDGNFKALAARGARVQRPLWASTSTKNPAYPDTKYVDPLIGPHTVNTLPPDTIEATLDHGKPALTIREDVAAAKQVFTDLRQAGIEIDDVTAKLLRDGVDAFIKSFDQLLENLEAKRAQLA